VKTNCKEVKKMINVAEKREVGREEAKFYSVVVKVAAGYGQLRRKQKARPGSLSHPRSDSPTRAHKQMVSINKGQFIPERKKPSSVAELPIEPPYSRSQTARSSIISSAFQVSNFSVERYY
jgi:hypothetical protein